jgi:threonine/homoserine/homoserine lactone efflux protein
MDPLLTLPQSSGFLAAAILITVAPGPDNLMVLALGMARGRRAGMAFGLGCAIGCLSHTMLATLGISALIAASASAFTAFKIIGGGYLLWLGIQALRKARSAGTGNGKPLPEVPTHRLFARGLLANAINPKVILFFLAFLPQFVDAGRGHAGWQMAQLGAIFTLQAALIFGAIGWSAGRLGQWLARRPRVGLWLDRIAGSIFVALGLRLIITR